MKRNNNSTSNSRDMAPARTGTFAELAKKVGHTPLYRVEHISVANDNQIIAKLEYRNPTGSHYDRVYVALLKELEERGKIQPRRDHLVEVTSGSAGAAFAWVCHELGYAASVVVPSALPPNRIHAITQYGATVVALSGYIPECVHHLQFMLTEEKPPSPAERYYCPNHSRRYESTVALESLAAEAIDQYGKRIDYFVAAVGNGISILGPGRVLKRAFGTTVIAWDPLAGPSAFERKYPGRYHQMFGLEPGALGPHRIYGTGVLGVPFPILDEALGLGSTSAIIDEVQLVADDDTLSRLTYEIQVGRGPQSALANARSLAELSSIHSALALEEELPVGYSSSGSLAVALELCQRERGKTILVIFYDDNSKY